MKKYINTSNYYLSTLADTLDNKIESGSFEVVDIVRDGVELPEKGLYWIDIDFNDPDKREIFRITRREGYVLFFDQRISPNGKYSHIPGASVGLRDFSQLLNSLSTNTDNFGEIEKFGDLQIKIRGGNVYKSGSASIENIHEIGDHVLTVQDRSESYVVLDLTEWRFRIISKYEFNDFSQYPIGKIITNETMIVEIVDLRSTMVGGGDMRAEVYDPQNKYTDAFHMDNMTQGETNKYVFQENIDQWNDYEENKQDKLISGENIKTINGLSILEPGNISLDTILTVGWRQLVTEDGATEYQFTDDNKPLDSKSFLVFSDSGTMMFAGIDYEYLENEFKIVFNSPLAETEHAYIWCMVNKGIGEVEIGTGELTLKAGDISLGTFNANQGDDKTIDIKNKKITVKVAGDVEGEFTTNQQQDSVLDLPGSKLLTDDEYKRLPESKNTDGNRYYIYS